MKSIPVEQKETSWNMTDTKCITHYFLYSTLSNILEFPMPIDGHLGLWRFPYLLASSAVSFYVPCQIHHSSSNPIDMRWMDTAHELACSNHRCAQEIAIKFLSFHYGNNFAYNKNTYTEIF